MNLVGNKSTKKLILQRPKPPDRSRNLILPSQVRNGCRFLLLHRDFLVLALSLVTVRVGGILICISTVAVHRVQLSIDSVLSLAEVEVLGQEGNDERDEGYQSIGRSFKHSQHKSAT